MLIMKNKLQIILFSLPFFMFSCFQEDPLSDPNEEVLEKLIIDDGGSTGLEISNNGNLVIFNFEHFSVLDSKGAFLFQTTPEKHGINTLVIANDLIFVAGKSKESSGGKPGISAYDSNGNPLWEIELEVPEEEVVETMSLKWFNSRLLLFLVSGSEQSIPPFHKSIPFFEISLTGELMTSNLGQLATDVDYFANHILILSDNKMLIQGSRKIREGIANEGVLVYLIEEGQLKWGKEFGNQGFQAINKIKENGLGGFWFVGTRQTIAWAIEIDSQGNKVSEINHQTYESGKNWFYDLEFTKEGILFAGFTNKGDGDLDEALIALFNRGGDLIKEEAISQNSHNSRVYAVRKRGNDEIVFAGWQLNQNSNRFDSWIFSKFLEDLN